MAGTNFKYGVRSMGVPIIGSGLPVSYGTYYFVDADSGSDGNDGKSMTTAFATISAAYTAATTNKNDVIVLSSNAAHSLTEMLTVSKNRIHFVAAPFFPRKTDQRARITMGVTTAATDVSMVKVTGMGVTFSGIKFYSTNTLAQHLYTVDNAGEAAVYLNCCFEANHKLSTATVAELLEQGDSCRYVECTIGTPSANASAARPVLLFDATVGNSSVSSGVEFTNCRFTHWTSAATKPFVKIAANGDVYDYAIFDNCIFHTKVAEGTVATDKAFDPPASLTSGTVIIKDCAFSRVTDIAATGDNAGIYVQMPGQSTAATVGKMVQPTS